MKMLPRMLHAALEGRKTVTRRLRGLDRINEEPDAWLWMSVRVVDGERLYEFLNQNTGERLHLPCPYGDVGRRLFSEEFDSDVVITTEEIVGKSVGATDES